MNGMDIELKAQGNYTTLSYTNWFDQYIYELGLTDPNERSEFEVKLLEHKRMIYKACNRYKSQIQNDEEYGDLLQEALVILQTSIERYTPIVSGRKVKFSSYLFIMLDGYLQKSFNEKFRGIKLTQTSFKNDDTKYVDFKIEGEDKTELIENNSSIHYSDKYIDMKDKVSKLLNDDEMKLVSEYYEEGYSYSEMAKIYGCSKQTISKRIAKILIKLKGEL